MLETLEASVYDQSELVLSDPQYNFQRKSRRFGAHYDKLATNAMAVMVMLCKHLMYSVSQKHVFCTNIKFFQYIQVTQGAQAGNQ